MTRETRPSLQAAIDDLLKDETIRQEVEAEASALIAASDLLTELDRLRDQQGLTKAELARKAGLQPSNVRKMLSLGTGRVELVTYLRLIRALGLELSISSQAEHSSLDALKTTSKLSAPAHKSRQLNRSF